MTSFVLVRALLVLFSGGVCVAWNTTTALKHILIECADSEEVGKIFVVEIAVQKYKSGENF